MEIFVKFLILTLLLSQAALANLTYPKAKKIQNVEFRFGEVITDEYKWMENPTDPDLWDWVAKEQELTLSNLDQINFDYFYNRLIEVDKIKKKNQEQMQQNMQAQVKFQNELANSYLPFLLTEQSNELEDDVISSETLYEYSMQPIFGGDLYRIVITESGTNLLKDILIVKYPRFIKWETKNTFLYMTSNDGITGESRAKLLRHKVGDNQADDEVLYTASHPKVNLTYHEVQGEFFIRESDARDKSTTIFQYDLKTKQKSFETKIEGEFQTILSKNYVFHISFDGANNGKLVNTDLVTKNSYTLISEQDFVMSRVMSIGSGLFVLAGHKDAEGKMYLFNNSLVLKEVKFPKVGSARFMWSGNQEANKVNFMFQSYDTPLQIYSYNTETDELTLEFSQAFPTSVEAIKTHYTAPNGQAAAITIVKSKATKLSPTTPMIIYGYGGFNHSLLPSFDVLQSMPWVEKGGAVAVVSLPGSLTYGKEWNDFAKFGGRVNSWDAFASAGKKLIELGYTSSEHLGMAGGSNGGLLVAGTLQRHPELFKAATPMVGVYDLLNYNLFTAGKYWEWEYGNPFIERFFYELVDISPYHKLQKMDYPAVMVMTAEFDDRVVPSHSFKYAARMQQMTTGDAPILLYNKEWGGHSNSSGSEKQKFSYVAAMYTFFAQHLGLNKKSE